MPNLSDQMTEFALRQFHAREELPFAPAGGDAAGDNPGAAALSADVDRIMAMLAQRRSPADALGIYLGHESALRAADGGPLQTKSAASLAAAAISKRPNTATPSAPAPNKSWAMRRFS